MSLHPDSMIDVFIKIKGKWYLGWYDYTNEEYGIHLIHRQTPPRMKVGIPSSMVTKWMKIPFDMVYEVRKIQYEACPQKFSLRFPSFVTNVSKILTPDT